MLPDTDKTTVPTPTSSRVRNYYLVPLIAEENTGIQHCAYFNEQWSRVWPSNPLDSNQDMSIRIEQADTTDISTLPPGLQGAIDPNAILAGAAVRPWDTSSTMRFIPMASDGSITVNITAGQQVGAIFLFSAKDGSFGLRPTTDPQITNSGPG